MSQNNIPPSIEVETVKLEAAPAADGTPGEVNTDDIFRDIIQKMPIAFGPIPFGRSWAVLQQKGKDGKPQNWAVLTVTQNNVATSVWCDLNDLREIMMGASAVAAELTKLNVTSGSGLVVASQETAQHVINEHNKITGAAPVSRDPKPVNWPPQDGKFS